MADLLRIIQAHLSKSAELDHDKLNQAFSHVDKALSALDSVSVGNFSERGLGNIDEVRRAEYRLKLSLESFQRLGVEMRLSSGIRPAVGKEGLEKAVAEATREVSLAVNKASQLRHGDHNEEVELLLKRLHLALEALRAQEV